ncbi:matrixin family metalloprotease [Planomonospora corallina]|uniref:Matrixin family metalloprotease n=1 Tax=Planomonospora corallina TaxID=1806052 RepID=A0ABV8I6S4_9ACTN
MEESGRRTGADGYRFLHTRDDGEPVRWSTCEPIGYVVRPEGRPEGAERLLRESVGRISEVTGLRFSYQGSIGEAPGDGRKAYQPDRYGERWAPVLIAYSAPDEYPRLRGQAAGYGGPVYVRAGNGTPRYVSGMVVFDAGQMASMGGDDAMRAVMLHELAHLVGLGHVDDPGQLMNPVQYGRRVTTLQGGDLAGLKAVGDGQCYEPVEPRSIGQ